jgi:hypothetical protein
MGWNWAQDVRAAVDFVSRRPAVRDVGLLSTGAEVVVTEAARDPRVRAVVAEGMINRDLADSAHQSTSDDVTGLPYWVVTFAALTIESGTQAPEPLTDDLRLLASRPLLIISADRKPPERAVARVWGSERRDRAPCSGARPRGTRRHSKRNRERTLVACSGSSQAPCSDSADDHR